MAKVIETGTFKELIMPSLVEVIKRRGKEDVFMRLRKDLQGTDFEEDIEELYKELAEEEE